LSTINLFRVVAMISGNEIPPILNPSRQITYFHETSYQHYIVIDHSKLVLSCTLTNFFFFVAYQSKSGLYRVVFEVSTSHTMRYAHRLDSSERVISASKNPLFTQQTNKQKNTRVEQPCPQRDSNSQSQQSSGCRHSP